MKYPNYVSQYTQKLQTLAYIEKTNYKSKKRHKRIPTKQLKSKKKIYIPFNKVPGQQSALIRNQTSSELVKIMMFDWLH